VTRTRGVRIALALLVVLGGAARAGEAIAPRVADESVDERFYAVLAGGIAERGHYGDRSHGPFRPFHAAPGAPIAFAAAYAVTPAPPAEPTDIPVAYWLLAVAWDRADRGELRARERARGRGRGTARRGGGGRLPAADPHDGASWRSGEVVPRS
jgi:hypothetical protein